jgi:phage tail-like protein
MDVNGSRFHLLLGRDDWGRRCRTESDRPLEEAFFASENGGDADFSWDAKRNELTLGRRLFDFHSSPGNRAVRPEQRRGAAIDRFANIYQISADRTEILVNSAATRETTHFWASLDLCGRACDTGAFGGFSAIPGDAAAEPIALSGLAVTTHHYLVAGTIDPPGLLVFDLQTGGAPRQLLWPAPAPFAPFDLSAATDGGVFILDQQGRRVWQLDRTFAVVSRDGAAPAARPEDFTAIDGRASHPAVRPSAVTLDLAIPIAAAEPVAIAALPDGSFLILDSPPGVRFSTVLRYQDGAQAGAGVSTSAAASFVDPSLGGTFRLLGHDFAYAEAWAGTQGPLDDLLFVVGEDGDQAFAFQLTRQGEQIDLHPMPEFFPLRLYGGESLIIGSGPQSGRAFYDVENRWVPLVAQRAARFAESATLHVQNLDGKQPDCVWHRLLIDACIPPECEVIVATRASNDPALLPFVAWNQDEPQLLRRATGSELPWSTAERAAGLDTWELLFQRATGHYLELRLTVRGSGRNTPRIRALRAWYPRFSYLDHYLPAAYRENAESASFLDRFLANFEGFFTNIEDRIAGVQLLLDVRSAPAEALEWLAGWFGVALDPAWDEARRRLFLRHATDFFEWRGTVPGLRMALRLVLDDCPSDSIFDVRPKSSPAIRIVEKFSTRTTPGAVYGDTSEAAGLPLRAQQCRWDPAQGAVDLERRYAELTGRRYPTRAPDQRPDPAGRAAWVEFSRQTLGFVPRATSGDADLWRQFLKRRYPSLAALNDAWRATYGDWSAIALPDVLPPRAAALRDWLQFEGIVLATRDAAHRFTVFLPQSTLMADEKRLDLARRVAGLEKPAHTSFDVKFYWAFFRVGEARLGEDTVVDVGGRSPEFLAPFVLDRNYLGSGYLAPDRWSRLPSPCPRPDGGCTPSSTPGGSR